VTFIKKDGTSRTIICTRDTNLIPKELRDTLAEGYKAKRKETAAIPVWELNLAEWRSFTSEQVTDIRFCK